MTLGFHKTRTSESIRVWFPLIRQGSLVPSGVFSDFSVYIIDGNDSISTSPFVTESNIRGGIYYFDIDSSFFVTSGVGDYSVSIEVNKTSSPKVTDVYYGHLNVTQEDFDSLSGSIWNSQASDYNISGTMGWAQNQIVNTFISGSGVILSSGSQASLVNAIWDEPNDSHLITGTMGDSLFSGSNPQVSGSFTVDGESIADSVWNRVTSSNNTPGTMGWLQNKMLPVSQSIEKTRALTCGRWLISGSQMIFYDEDNITEVARYNLFDTEGDPFFSEANAPAERVVT